MFRLLSLKCFSCHQFRLSSRRVRQFKVRLALLEANLFKAAHDYTRCLANFRSDKNASYREFINEEEATVFYEHLAAKKAYLLELSNSSSLQASARVLSSRDVRHMKMHIHCRTAWLETVKEFYSNVPGRKCENCGSLAFKLKRDGFCKIFILPLSKSDAVDQLKSGNSPEFNAAFRVDENKEEYGAQADHDDEKQEKAHDNMGERKLLHPLETMEQMKQLWSKEKHFVEKIWARPPFLQKNGQIAFSLERVRDSRSLGFKAFFIQSLAVPPSKFRPPQHLNGMVFEHPQTVALQKTINLNKSISSYYSSEAENQVDTKERLKSTLKDWITLQETVNGLLDSSKGGTYNMNLPNGIRQIIEKKRGLFRQNMMGKRVNYAARSVISPDPLIGTDEIGLPVRFATKLTYPEPVTSFNRKKLAQMVRNGPFRYPGALYVEDENGSMIDLSKRNWRQRAALANNLQNARTMGQLDGRVVHATKAQKHGADSVFRAEHSKQLAPLSLRGQKRVWRHVETGDVMLANRQPTLHKPSIMAHKVRVINNRMMQTLRLHYANCNTYNADFDGDEMNLHLPQNENGRAEAFEIAYTNRQYCSNTNGKPLRGLIQDHIDMGVLLTEQNTFLKKSEYVQLVYAACSGTFSTNSEEIKLLSGSILKPVELWTGKQVISTILINLVGSVEKEDLLSMGPTKAKTPAKVWNSQSPNHKLAIAVKTKTREEAIRLIGGVDGPLGQSNVVVRDGLLCCGILDKAHFGSSSYGLVHCVYEVYGATAAGELLSAFGKLFTFCCQKWGHTCAMEDLLLSPTAEKARLHEITQSELLGIQAIADFAQVRPTQPTREIANALSRRLRQAEEFGGDAVKEEAKLDAKVQTAMSKVTSSIIQVCLPSGQRKPFPSNGFALMVNTGAKGSLVNFSQVSCALGQQALEGRRVPRMISGKSLPSFEAFDPKPRAGGYISDRFLTGIRPQEYFFHCMAGREGLVDTAVKTSRSGYLQRCLIKQLETLQVCYDRTVRADDGSVVQFKYGEDGLDTLDTAFLNGSDSSMCFLYENISPLCTKLKVGSGMGQLNLESSKERTYGFPHSLCLDRAPILHKQIRLMRKALAKSTKSCLDTKSLKTGSTVLARKPKRVRNFKGKKINERDFMEGFHAAVVTKVHKGGNGFHTCPAVDLLFEADSFVAKRMPVWISATVVAAGVVGSRKDIQRSFKEKNAMGVTLKLPLVYLRMPDPVIHQLENDLHLGAVPEMLEDKIDDYLNRNPHNLIKQEDDALALKQLIWLKFMRALVPPGESVGVLAAQSIGEPSTQMTLNTFHLAGHGGANVTLGIPRMRELLMTASTSIKTPSMKLPLKIGDMSTAKELQSLFTKIRLTDLLQPKDGITVREVLFSASADHEKTQSFSTDYKMPDQSTKTGWLRHYKIRFHLQDIDLIKSKFDLSMQDVAEAVGTSLGHKLLREIARELRHSGHRIRTRDVKRQKLDNVEKEDKDESGEDMKEESSSESESDNDSSEEENDSALPVESSSEDGNSEDRGSENDNQEQDIVVDSSMNGQIYPKETPPEFHRNGKGDHKHFSNEQKRFPDLNGIYDDMVSTKKENEPCFPVAVASTVSKSKCWKGCMRSAESKTKNGWIQIILQFPASAKKLLMINIVERVASKTIIKALEGIDSSRIVESKQDSSLFLQVQGCNLQAVWEHGHILDMERIETNDVAQVLSVYGVEAAKTALVREVKNVFGVYGIHVDSRHMNLIADYMTYEGGYRPFNRAGIDGTTSPLLRITFESSTAFLTNCALFGEKETLYTPSSRIALGQLIRAGTGGIDLMIPIKESVFSK